MTDNGIELTGDLLSTFAMFPNFRRPINNSEKRIMTIKFSGDGEKLLAASNQRTLEVFNCNSGELETYLPLHKYGIGAVDFLGSSDMILVGSSVTNDFALRELNTSKNEFVTTYTGHKRPSISLAVNRNKKWFLSGGFDRSAMLFDFRIPTAQVCLENLAKPPKVLLHPKSEYLCAMGIGSDRIEFHDLRYLNLEPFTVFKFNADETIWHNIKFSPDGDQLLISTSSPKIRVIDSFLGTQQANFDSRRNSIKIAIDASFTPQGEYILSGSSDGKVFVYNNSKKVHRKTDPASTYYELKSMEPEAITAVEFNPKYTLMASASSYVAFWAPSSD